MRLEPMSIDEIKDDVQFVFKYMPTSRRVRIILAWAHERARVNKLILEGGSYDPTDKKWINQVLDEIGWPEDQR